MIRLLKPCSAADQQGVSGLWTPPAPSELPTIWIRGTAPSAGQIRHSRLYLQNMFLIPDSRKLKKNKDGTRRWTLPEITPNSAAHLCDDMRCKVQQTRRKYKPSIDVSEDPSGPKSGLMWKLHQEPSVPTRTWPGGRLQHASPTWREKNTTALHPQSRPSDSRRQGEVRKHQCAETNNFRLLLWKKSSWFWAGQVDTDVILIWE